MNLYPLELLAASDFISWLNGLGVELDDVGLAALVDAGLLSPLADAQHCPLQGFVIIAYAQAVQLIPPLAVSLTGDPGALTLKPLDEFVTWARTFDDALQTVARVGVVGRGWRSAEQLHELVQQFMELHSPLHGPFKEIVGWLKPEALASWPAPAARWASLTILELQLSAMLRGELERASEPTVQLDALEPAARLRRTAEIPALELRMTKPAGLRPVSEPSTSEPEAQPAQVVASPEVPPPSTAQASAALRVTAEMDLSSLREELHEEPPAEPAAESQEAHEPELTVATEDQQPRAPEDEDDSEPLLELIEVSEQPQASLDEPSDALEPVEPAAAPAAISPDDASHEEELEEGHAPERASDEPFERPVQATVRTLELNKRLDALRGFDGKRAPAPSLQLLSVPEPSVADALTEAVAASEPEEQLPAPSLDQEPTSAPQVQIEEASDALELGEEVSLVEIQEPGPPPRPALAIKAPEIKLGEDVVEDLEVVDAPVEPATVQLDVDAAPVDADAQAAQAAPLEEDSPQENAEDPKAHQRHLAERIRELNKKREQFIREQSWAGLVQLYEDGIELFDDPEKLQIYLTLSKLYELKLGQIDGALHNAMAVFDLIDKREERLKHLALVTRLGLIKEGQPAYEAWLNERLSQAQREDDDPAWQRALALGQAQLGLVQGKGLDALLGLADFIIARPEQLLDDTQLLELLEAQAKGLEYQAVIACYDYLVEQLKAPTALFAVCAFAGMSAVEHDDDDAAIRFLERAFELNPKDEATFHTLASIYEEASLWPQLVSLHDSKLELEPEHPTLMARRDEFLSRELEHTDQAIERYSARLKRDPDDLVAISRVFKAYVEAGRVGEVYGFLSGHLEQAKSAAARAQVLYDLAQVAMEQLYAPEEATIHLERIAELVQGDKAALERLMLQCMRYEIWSVVLNVIDETTRSSAVKLDVAEQVRWFGWGAQAAERAGRQLEQRRFLQNILVLEPNNREAQSALNML